MAESAQAPCGPGSGGDQVPGARDLASEAGPGRAASVYAGGTSRPGEGDLLAQPESCVGRALPRRLECEGATGFRRAVLSGCLVLPASSVSSVFRI